MTLRVLIADDQALVRTGFRMILDARGDIDVVGEAGDGAEAVRLVVDLVPDVVLMDVRMPDVDGIEATRRIVASGCPSRIVILTTYDVDEYVYAALRAGASGFMLKDVRPAELVEGVRVVARGDALLAASVTRRLLDHFVATLPADAAPAPPDLGLLTAREVEVLRLAGRRAVERRDRRPPGGQRDHGEDPRVLGAAEARAARPGPGRRARPTSRPRAAPLVLTDTSVLPPDEAEIRPPGRCRRGGRLRTSASCRRHRDHRPEQAVRLGPGRHRPRVHGPAGRVTGFLGPNGAGKSTTVRMLLGLIRAQRRHRHFRGPPVRPAGPCRARHVGAVLEHASFHPGRSGRNHLRVLAAAGGHPPGRVDDVLDQVGLTAAADRRVKGYSMGMRQRLAIAAALLGDPEVLILDEPTNGLDPPGIRWVRDLVRAEAARGRAVLISSHLLSEVALSVDDVVVIANGRLRAAGPLDRCSVRAATPPPWSAARTPAGWRGLLDGPGPGVERDGPGGPPRARRRSRPRGGGGGGARRRPRRAADPVRLARGRVPRPHREAA